MSSPDPTAPPTTPTVQDIIANPSLRCVMGVERSIGRLDRAGLEALQAAECAIGERREQAKRRADAAMAEIRRDRPGRMTFAASGEIDTARRIA